mmetsp:Transcript_21243/g.66725  ORF Transcript_21243/g.66725 Transcript_21243/m.66725 type:complete len:232 (-) Transcript_21243:577-1272(-)
MGSRRDGKAPARAGCVLGSFGTTRRVHSRARALACAPPGRSARGAGPAAFLGGIPHTPVRATNRPRRRIPRQAQKRFCVHSPQGAVDAAYSEAGRSAAAWTGRSAELDGAGGGGSRVGDTRGRGAGMGGSKSGRSRSGCAKTGCGEGDGRDCGGLFGKSHARPTGASDRARRRRVGRRGGHADSARLIHRPDGKLIAGSGEHLPQRAVVLLPVGRRNKAGEADLARQIGRV